MKLKICLIMVFMTYLRSVGGFCGGGWKKFETSCYFYAGILNKSNAKSSCLGMNASLLSINSAAEMNFITDWLGKEHTYWVDVVRREGSLNRRDIYHDGNINSVAFVKWDDNVLQPTEYNAYYVTDNQFYISSPSEEHRALCELEKEPLWLCDLSTIPPGIQVNGGDMHGRMEFNRSWITDRDVEIILRCYGGLMTSSTLCSLDLGFAIATCLKAANLVSRKLLSTDETEVWSTSDFHPSPYNGGNLNGLKWCPEQVQGIRSWVQLRLPLLKRIVAVSIQSDSHHKHQCVNTIEVSTTKLNDPTTLQAYTNPLTKTTELAIFERCPAEKDVVSTVYFTVCSLLARIVRITTKKCEQHCCARFGIYGFDDNEEGKEACSSVEYKAIKTDDLFETTTIEQIQLKDPIKTKLHNEFQCALSCSLLKDLCKAYTFENGICQLGDQLRSQLTNSSLAIKL